MNQKLHSMLPAETKQQISKYSDRAQDELAALYVMVDKLAKEGFPLLGVRDTEETVLERRREGYSAGECLDAIIGGDEKFTLTFNIDGQRSSLLILFGNNVADLVYDSGGAAADKLCDRAIGILQEIDDLNNQAAIPAAVDLAPSPGLLDRMQAGLDGIRKTAEDHLRCKTCKLDQNVSLSDGSKITDLVWDEEGGPAFFNENGRILKVGDIDVRKEIEVYQVALDGWADYQRRYPVKLDQPMMIESKVPELQNAMWDLFIALRREGEDQLRGQLVKFDTPLTELQIQALCVDADGMATAIDVRGKLLSDDEIDNSLIQIALYDHALSQKAIGEEEEIGGVSLS